eukprot:CAMPEP_0196997712 /NCGR_PEP_ID=MMETSP1380-20130617/3257_1 /TAXON_ID=5936 /ORGANISM="Euplotes crassus, Strain CT5" /LENGTH=106 /DNA_ID=CAMNT_0042414031 /DNA_START=106 /DNA_END=426 /DNA_ORIENTATION=-
MAPQDTEAINTHLSYPKSVGESVHKQPDALTAYKKLPEDMYDHYYSSNFPDAPSKLEQYLKDVYFTLNLCREDPEFFLKNFLIPIRKRYTKDGLYKDFLGNLRPTD